MIAFSQINQILTCSLSARFHNKCTNQSISDQEAPKVSTLNTHILLINIANLVIDLATLAYFTVAFKRIHDYYVSMRTLEDGAVFSELLVEISNFIGYMMAASVTLLVIGYFFLRKSFGESESMRRSDYIQRIQTGLLIIAVSYVFRAFYSIPF